MGEGAIEHRAAGVGVDLDELRAAVADVKVEAHEHAPWPGIELGDVGCARSTSAW